MKTIISSILIALLPVLIFAQDAAGSRMYDYLGKTDSLQIRTIAIGTANSNTSNITYGTAGACLQWISVTILSSIITANYPALIAFSLLTYIAEIAFTYLHTVNESRQITGNEYIARNMEEYYQSQYLNHANKIRQTSLLIGNIIGSVFILFIFYLMYFTF